MTIERFDDSELESGGEYAFLSNFYPARTYRYINGHRVIFHNAEAAYQSAKSLDSRLQYAFTELSSPRHAKVLGNSLPLRPDWDSVKNSIMYDVVKSKFTINLKLQDRLIATGDQELIEGNTWHDNYWGNCICSKCKNIAGLNYLGKILMKIRKVLSK